jgi:Protein of unknown function
VSSTLAAGAHLDLTLAQQLTVITLCALTAYISHIALAVFNDGVRPFLLDPNLGRTTRSATTAVSFGLSAGFVLGLGAPMALSTGVLNPWLLFLPTDILGILSPRKWIAPVLGGAWGAVAVFGLDGGQALAAALTDAEGAGHAPHRLLETAGARSAARTLIWRIQRLAQRQVPSARARAAQARTTTASQVTQPGEQGRRRTAPARRAAARTPAAMNVFGIVFMTSTLSRENRTMAFITSMHYSYARSPVAPIDCLR